MSTAQTLAQTASSPPVVPHPAPPPVSPMGMSMSEEWWSGIDEGVRAFAHELATVLSAAPQVPHDLAAGLHSALMMDGDPSRAFFAAMAAIAASVLALFAFRSVTKRSRFAGLDDASPLRGAMQLLAWDIADRIVFIIAAILLGRIAISHWGNDAGFTKALLRGIVDWYAQMLFARVLLRPGSARFRILPINPEAAHKLTILFGLVLALGVTGPTFLPLLVVNDMPTLAARFIGLFLEIAVAITALITVRTLARSLSETTHVAAPAWVSTLGSTTVIILGACWAWSIVMAEFRVFWALLGSTGIIASVIVIDVLLGLPCKDNNRGKMKLLRGIFRFSASVIIMLEIGHLWFGSQGAMPIAEWKSISLAIASGGATLFIGYMIWELTNFWAERALGANRIIDPTQVDDDEMLEPASRLATFFPMARVLIGITILLIAVMVALSNLGVNVAPLLAGAGVFGLAISFGSQSLIKDILSGVFFMADDAFRVGEYIDTGRLKGTVEQISLRSLRLRHQNGQVHTIPYGQLQSITNFSRDWATMKFTLRIDPSSDLEQVRKVVKKVGLAMVEDPELGKELLQPVKLQGVQEIQDNALVVRIKFTARPNKPTWVQREALKRIILAFRENGIKFAANAVTIAGGAQGNVSPEIAAAASAAATTPGARFPTAAQ